jgi:hypothetical protein
MEDIIFQNGIWNILGLVSLLREPIWFKLQILLQLFKVYLHKNDSFMASSLRIILFDFFNNQNELQNWKIGWNTVRN